MKPLDRLRAEQSRAKAEMKIRETRISEKLDYLEDNFGKMAIHSVLPFSSEQIQKAGNILNPVNNFIEKLIPSSISDEKREKYKSIIKTVEMAAAGLAYKYIRKFF
jgi:hypothetical protein